MIHALSNHKGAIGWSDANSKGVSPTICMHRLHLEDDAKPIREIQCRLKPHLKEVVQKGVVKLYMHALSISYN